MKAAYEFIRTGAARQALHAAQNARKKAGLTQIQLEKRLRTYKGYVSKYESGERELTLRELLEIAEALNVDPLSLIKPNQ
ncbi:helix-turn-helix domain-containing protein [Microvirga tunisiensis]|uniref:Helix-turn-helix transcriptional regulator n=1 Tax=Microvirga tunisiensis TaxID=2108360 RepID=A0A5N7MMZ8_9HYPH|nr:helix-turn-helix transcriptional regulator [Microvirga tunisiensis]MPR07118.1 helix-turn-helix transcriptional regulator [Microvirga tunisiensis]MPR25366.1 helix-turn-helix transcriptional regulator [Microvirga tunisiensis]